MDISWDEWDEMQYATSQLMYIQFEYIWSGKKIATPRHNANDNLIVTGILSKQPTFQVWVYFNHVTYIIIYII